MSEMNLEPLLLLVKKFEGLKLKAYKCPAGVWTCGYGTTGKDVKEGTVFTLEQAEQRLREEVEKAVSAAKNLSPRLTLPENANRLLAVADFIYNAGAGNYAGSTLRKKIDAGDFDGAAQEFRRWVFAKGVKLPGLVKRREEERKLFLA
jgi:lysozyme